MKSLIFFLFTYLAFSQSLSAQEINQPMTDILHLLQKKRELIRAWAPLCEDGSQSHGLCPFGDMTIFSGILCLSGETQRCDDVKRAQGPDGRWWRSPQLVGIDTEVNTFSRDQANGALAYLVATKDIDAALKWQAYLEAHHQRMCPKATDNRCKITMGSSQLFGAVWQYLGLTPAKWMNRGIWIAQYYNQIEALVQPDDFPMHLNALYVWIRQEIEDRGGQKSESVNQKVMKILVKREPTNPFFLLLRNGATPEVAQIILEKCPDEKPSDSLLDWSWQRSQKSKVWLHASGHDCIFIINAFEKELNKSLTL